MAKYVYPAILEVEKEGYSVFFPDLEGCYTQGDNLQDALEMAEDVLALTLYEYERMEKPIPAPTHAKSISCNENQIVSLVKCDTMAYRKKYGNKAIKKTLTIPEWLNEEAIACGVNFSQVLQEALLRIVNS